MAANLSGLSGWAKPQECRKYLWSLTIPVVLDTLTFFLANKWRLKASSQMMPAILYIVVYMRHTQIEKQISFASQHLQYPLGLDFKKYFMMCK